MKTCFKCKETKEDSLFYGGSNKYCKPCTRIMINARRKVEKQKAVDYLGGKCIYCGYNKSVYALQFHHKESTEKEFTLGSKSSFSFDGIKSELDKCILVCANCHTELHHPD